MLMVKCNGHCDSTKAWGLPAAAWSGGLCLYEWTNGSVWEELPDEKRVLILRPLSYTGSIALLPCYVIAQRLLLGASAMLLDFPASRTMVKIDLYCFV